jgi:hypothetical protein
VNLSDRQLTCKTNFHRVIAMAFLVLLFVEWGSHGLAFSHAYSPDGQAQAIGSDERGHEDPCKTMVHGTDGTRQEKPVPTSGHDIKQANIFFALSTSAGGLELEKDPRTSRSKVSGLFRPVSPPFHPPELS